MHFFLPAAIVTINLFLLAATVDAVPLSPRQVVSTLSGRFGSNGAVYRSNDKYDCDAYMFSVDGLNPPFSVDAVQAPYNPSATSFTVLEHIYNLTAPGDIAWAADLDVGTQFVFRTTNGLGEVAWSQVRSVKAPKRGVSDCDLINGSWWAEASDGVRALEIVLLLPVGCVGLCMVWASIRCCRRDARRARAHDQPAAQANGQPVGQPNAVELVVVSDRQPLAAAASPVLGDVGATAIPQQNAAQLPPNYEDTIRGKSGLAK